MSCEWIQKSEILKKKMEMEFESEKKEVKKKNREKEYENFPTNPNFSHTSSYTHLLHSIDPQTESLKCLLIQKS